MEAKKSIQDGSQNAVPDIEIVIRFDGNPVTDTWTMTVAMNPAKFAQVSGIAHTFEEAFTFCQDVFLSRISKAKRPKVASICQHIQVLYVHLLAPTLLPTPLS